MAEVKKVRVHTCNPKSVEGILIEGYIAGKCRCRKFVSTAKAEELIDDGYAKNIIVSFKKIDVPEQCPICSGVENFKKNCHFCKNSGVVLKPDILYTYGEDIYMRPFLKTPRTATVEKNHIEYAYVKGDRDAIRRIDLYQGLNLAALTRLGSSIIDSRTKEVIFEGTPEPEDDPKKATGRRYDYGRSI